MFCLINYRFSFFPFSFSIINTHLPLEYYQCRIYHRVSWVRDQGPKSRWPKIMREKKLKKKRRKENQETQKDELKWVTNCAIVTPPPIIIL